MDTQAAFDAQMDAELETWKGMLDEAPHEVLLVLAVAVIEILAEKYGTRIRDLRA